MTHLTESILSYISRDETDYALLITGGWGTGKTFYFKEVFKKELEVKYSDYKLIYVSLYGISSIKEISILIYDQISPLKANAMKWGGLLSKIALRGMDLSELFSLELGSGEDKKVIKGDSKSISEHFSDFFRINKQKIDKSKILLCFDDLERKDSSLTITQIAGFINSLLEEQAKVIVITNNNQVKEEEFTFLKEKTFGIQLEFPKNNKQNVVQLIDKTFEKYSLFRDWLKSKIEYFDDIFFQYEDNLRVFKLALQHFHKIYFYIESQKSNYEYIIFEELYNDILRFVCAVTIEFRKGKLNYYERNDIDNAYFSYTDMWTKEELLEMRSLISQNVKETTPHKPNFKETYYQGVRYKFYKSVYELITSEYLSNIDLNEELKEIENTIVKPEYKVLQDVVNDFGVYRLDDTEYKKSLIVILNFAYDEKYNQISDYATIYSYIKHRSNSYNIEIDEEKYFSVLKDIIKKQTSEQLNKNTYFFDSIRTNIEEDYNNFYSKIIQITKEEIEEREQLILKKIESNKDFESLSNFFEDKLHKSFIINESIVDSVFDIINEAKTPQLHEFHNLLNKRYRRNYIEENPKSELEGLTYFERLLREKIDTIQVDEPNRKIQFEGILDSILYQIKQIQNPL